MQKIPKGLSALFLFAFSCSICAQTNTFPATGSAGIGTTTPNASSILDMTSTTQGMLVPRMTKAQRDAIVSPAAGLMIYQTNLTPGFYYYSGTAWAAISAKGANTTLSNLVLPTAINQSLFPNATNTIDIGSSTARWRDIHLYNLKFSDGSTQTTAFIPYSAGTGIAIAANTITNMAPDQTVTLANGGGISVTGTYPNFTIASTLTSSQWATSGVNIYYNSGNVGIGTTTPSASLDVNGDAKINGLTAGRGGGNFISNAANGFQALYSNTTGSNNTANGSSALYSNTTGFQNNAFGYQALENNTTGNNNTAMGSYALQSNTTATGNVAVGVLALSANDIGANNTAVGTQALGLNSNGADNTAVGTQALYKNTTGIFNTAMGYSSMYGNGGFITGGYNSAFGASSLHTNTTGTFNTTAGALSMHDNTTGSQNTAVGYASLTNNTTGSNNTAVGESSLLANTTGFQNTAVGDGVLLANTTGQYNTGMGKDALVGNTIGTRNTAVGVNALNANANGVGNTAVGTNALTSNIVGDNNTAIGRQADITNSFSNSTAVGYDATVNAANRVILGNTFVTVIGGYTGWSNLSDSRFKKNIQSDVPGLDFIMRLKPVTYNMDVHKLNNFFGKKYDSEKDAVYAEKAMTEKEQIVYSGFEAQQVEKAAGSIGYHFSGVVKPQNDKDHYSIIYSDFIPSLVKAMQELKKENEILQQRLSRLENEKNK